jgi:hypothetical protein
LKILYSLLQYQRNTIFENQKKFKKIIIKNIKKISSTSRIVIDLNSRQPLSFLFKHADSCVSSQSWTPGRRGHQSCDEVCREMATHQ